MVPKAGPRDGGAGGGGQVRTRAATGVDRSRRSDELERFFELTPELACILRRDGSVERVNGRWTEALGWPRLRSVDRTHLVHPGDDAATAAAFRRMIEEPGTLVAFENRVFCIDGTEVRLSWQGSTDPATGRFLLVARDATRDALAAACGEIGADIDAFLVGAPTDLPGALGILTERLCRAVGWHAGVVCTAGDDGEWSNLVIHDPGGVTVDEVGIGELAARAIARGEAEWINLADAETHVADLETAHVVPVPPSADLPNAVILLLDQRVLLGVTRERRDQSGRTAARIVGRLCQRVRVEQEAASYRTFLEGRSRARTDAWNALASERHRAEREARHRRAQQVAAARVTRDALAERTVESLIDTSLSLVAEVLGVEFVGLTEPVGDGSSLLLRAGVGWPPDHIGKVQIDAAASQAGFALAAGRSVVSSDLRSESRFRAQYLVERGIASGMSVLVPGRDAPVGVLAAFSVHPRRFRHDDVAFLETIAHSISFAIEQDLARCQLAEVEEQERARISEGLHDDTLQVLAALALRVELFASSPAEGRDDALLVETVADLRRTADQLRTLAFELHPEGLGRLGLVNAIAQITEEFSRKHDVSVRFSHDVGAEPAVEVSAVVFQIAKEALTNVAKHAKAGAVELVVRSDREAVSVVVDDDGVGLPESGASRIGHLGLDTMRLRTRKLGGWARVGSSPLSGTRVEAWLPLS